MASVSDWIEGARLRTLPAAAAPVIVGSAAAHYLGGFSAVRAALALLVALALQVGVNYANDYSDGIRGTDDNRKGPARLTGGGLAKPKTVLAAALGSFAVAGVAGLALVAVSGTWWLIAAGAAAVVAAWFYTGGKHPYAYLGIGLSELMVFVFFGLLACVGTAWTQVQSAPWWLWMSASALGLLSVALLMANNIRDIPTDRESGSRRAPGRSPVALGVCGVRVDSRRVDRRAGRRGWAAPLRDERAGRGRGSVGCRSEPPGPHRRLGPRAHHGAAQHGVLHPGVGAVGCTRVAPVLGTRPGSLRSQALPE